MKKENSGFGSLRKHEDLMLILLTVILVVFFSIMKPSFFTLNSFASIARQIPEIGLFTLAMMLPMLVGGIDLSIISTANLATVLMGLFMNRYIPKGEENVPVVICALLICAAVCLPTESLKGALALPGVGDNVQGFFRHLEAVSHQLRHAVNPFLGLGLGGPARSGTQDPYVCFGYSFHILPCMIVFVIHQFLCKVGLRIVVAVPCVLYL